MNPYIAIDAHTDDCADPMLSYYIVLSSVLLLSSLLLLNRSVVIPCRAGRIMREADKRVKMLRSGGGGNPDKTTDSDASMDYVDDVVCSTLSDTDSSGLVWPEDMCMLFDDVFSPETCDEILGID